MWLWGLLNASRSAGVLRSADEVIALADLASSSLLTGGQLEALRARSVLLVSRRQLTTALALIELDGVARRIVLCPPDFPAAHMSTLIRTAGVDACVVEASSEPPAAWLPEFGLTVSTLPCLQLSAVERRQSQETEWILLTSGTSGAPKLVLHTCRTLTHAFAGSQPPPSAIVWGTFYDIRRYGGLQILLRSLRSGSMVLSDVSETITQFLMRLRDAGATHISGTPSHWRQALMSGYAPAIAPCYVRLSGEVADQAILDALQSAFIGAAVEHAFASTEAGVAFTIDDRLAGIPESALGAHALAETCIVDGTLRIRGAGTAICYLGGDKPLKDGEGFIDTGDRLELRDGRYYFVGRVGGVINVGGLKVHPEEVEAVINSHPDVQMSLVKARRSPITGMVVTADAVLVKRGTRDDAAVRHEIRELCQRSLAAYKVPVIIRIVPTLELSAAGKLVRRADA
jgi:acyl-coenzyme A synthetase/AMP-(fatty) acid ligase